MDYNHFLDVNVHTTAEEYCNSNNNSNNSNKTTRNDDKLIIKKRGPGRPAGRKTENDNNKLITTNSSNVKNGDLNCSQSSTDAAIDAIDGGSSSLMDIADYDDDNIWPDNDNDNDHDHDTEDFDNQLLFMPPPPLSNNDCSNVQNSENVRTVRRQIRGTAYCSLCNKTFQYYSLYRNHMTKHSNETPFKCVLCKKGFKSKQAIRYHMHTHEKEKRHKCPLCHAAYYTENQVITHLLSHENSTIFPCMVCGKILRSDAERDLHLTTHTEERPYRCEYCNKLFRLRHHLSNHLKIHRQYRCDFCKSTFISALHQRKPYACNICNKHPHVQRQIEQAQNVTSSSQLSQLSSDINPLQLFDNMEPPKPPINSIDLAEMVSENSTSTTTSNSSSSSSSNSRTSDDDANINVNVNGMIDDTIIKSENNTWLNCMDTSLNNDKQQRLSCTYCPRTYSNVSALNYHIRQKHIVVSGI